jgi:hypothetical protein
MRAGIAWRSQLDAVATATDFAGVGRIETVKDLRQRALASAVLAKQGNDFTAMHREVLHVISEDASKPLDDSVCFKERRLAAAVHSAVHLG